MEANGQRFDVLGLGNSCLDQIFTLAPFPARGSSVPLAKLQTSAGGQVASALVGCRRLGLRAQFALRTGDDAAGARQRQVLQEEGIDLSLAAVVPGVPSASAYILLDQASGERAVIWNTDERLAVRPDEWPADAVAGARLLYIDGKDEAACLAAVRQARALGRPVVSDIDTPRPGTRALMAGITDFICNQEFLDALWGAGSLRDALRRVAAEGPQVACATLGAGGALALVGGQFVASPAFAVRVVDNTGAGDAFRAGYVFARLAGWPIEDRLAFANATAALACTALGAQAAMPRLADVLELLRREARAGAWDGLP